MFLLFWAFLCSYKLNLVIEDATGRAKIFLFGGAAEQVVRRTATELVEESSTNQILLPAALRSLVGRSYVFQVVISEHTFRTGQLSFQVRRVFTRPSVVGTSTPTLAKTGGSSSAENSALGKAPDKTPIDNDSTVPQTHIQPADKNTPPSDVSPIVAQKTTPANKAKEISSTPEEHGYRSIPWYYFPSKLTHCLVASLLIELTFRNIW